MPLSDADFIDQFERKILSPEHFNHIGHLRLAWLYLQKNSLTNAVFKTTTGIQAYANHLGATDKFHHTITEALVYIIHNRLIGQTDPTFADFLSTNQDLVNNAKAVIYQYYSEEILYSLEAKQFFIKPDKQAFTTDTSIAI
ncbi:hypothetical protein [Spartinivicinus ruber]|uniref:hypothetical protein n=1 Tax=Spartinivicinus ruber TaxID=2683272 RepID=UPI0013D8667C|nr:hypothetical protein [Spartinivicinus ruber]